MNFELKEFVDAERKRVVEPDAHFATRVMARVRDIRPHPPDIWEMVPAPARTVFALAAMLILTFLAIQSLVPAVPRGGAAVDDNLRVGADVLTSDEAFAALFGPEGGL
jgi:hypothetical protein